MRIFNFAELLLWDEAWIPLALQFDQSADLQPPLQHTDEA